MVKRNKNEQPRDYEEQPGVSNDAYRKIAGICMAGLVGGGITFIGWLGVGVSSLNNTVPVVISEQANIKDDVGKIEIKLEAHDERIQSVELEAVKNKAADDNAHGK